MSSVDPKLIRRACRAKFFARLFMLAGVLVFTLGILLMLPAFPLALIVTGIIAPIVMMPSLYFSRRQSSVQRQLLELGLCPSCQHAISRPTEGGYRCESCRDRYYSNGRRHSTRA
jgi:hypothetical protein